MVSFFYSYLILPEDISHLQTDLQKKHASPLISRIESEGLKMGPENEVPPISMDLNIIFSDLPISSLMAMAGDFFL